MELKNESFINVINDNSSTLNDSDSTFKKPQVLIGSRTSRNNFRKINLNEQNNQLIEKHSTEDDSNDISVSGVECETKEKNSQSKLLSNKPKAANLKYEEPTWSGLPTCRYILEEVKNGQIVKCIDLSQKPFIVIGRIEDCDIAMAHPTISRYHAILQYRSTADDEATTGFYLYDLSSTHGTFLNKQRIKPKIYIKLQVGHVIKFGCSTRLFVLYGPPEDRDPETELTWTELKQKHLDMTLAKEQQKIQSEKEELERLKKEEENGVDWGMGEDADEETDLTENPFAATQNEELYLDDPKKTLSGWFDREGEELEYIVEEKGFGHFICRVELPVEIGGLSKLTAEANVKGKKKEAVVQCALEACRLLDRHGLLRQANQESRKRIAKDWESVDYYDSDEDNFLDRTGDVEKKRKQRMAQAGKLESTVDTYETLVQKYEECNAALKEAESRLAAMTVPPTSENNCDADDELADYMNNLIKNTNNNVEIRKVKNQIEKFRVESERLRKLVNFAQPANLPTLAPIQTVSHKEKELGVNLQANLLTEKLDPKLKHDKDIQHKPSEEIKNIEEENVQEKFNLVSEPEKGKEQLRDLEKRQKRSRTRTQHQKIKKDKSTLAEDYSTLTWTPPSGQTGDGRTHLNDKLGY